MAVIKTYEDGSELETKHVAMFVVGAAIYVGVLTTIVVAPAEISRIRRNRKFKKQLKNIEFVDSDS